MPIKSTLTLLFFLSFSKLYSQQHSIAGKVVDNNQLPLPFATVALLHPADSTLAFFGITGNAGEYVIRSVTAGDYLLQTSFLGYKTIYIPTSIPVTNNSHELITMQPLQQSMHEVNITGERIPVRIKQDTIEYDAGAYKTKPDAVAEDVLKKLPGIEVDRAGNIKAQGEQVTNVLVDGKEFFSNDPKVATKNLPADAIDRVQVYDKKSDQAELTGIDDGEREKTINLMLKDDKKSAVFGDATVGAGTDEHYKLNAKLYRFTQTQQFAFLGMLNNINQFGFSFRDYMDFSGGMRNMSGGNGEFSFNTNSMLVNFGQQVNGLITSGAGGLNYTYEPKKGNRFNISYMLSGSDKENKEYIYTENFTDSISFTNNEINSEDSKNRNHAFNINWKNRMDSTQNLQVTANVELTRSKSDGSMYSILTSSIPENENLNTSDDKLKGINTKFFSSYLKKWKGNWRLFKLNADITYSQSLSEADWNNMSLFSSSGFPETEDKFIDDTNRKNAVSLTSSATRKLNGYYLLEPLIEAGISSQGIEREKGEFVEPLTSSISYDFKSTYNYIRPGVNLKWNKLKKHFLVGLKMEALELTGNMNQSEIRSSSYVYILPKLNWENEYKTGRRFGINYNSRVNTPQVSSLMPAVDDRNPLDISIGNPNLSPEYQHTMRVNWSIFDQFSFTTFFSNFYARYTKDKITWTSKINNDLSQYNIPVNTGDDYLAEMRFELTTPIRKAYVNINVEASETFNQGINIVNADENTTRNFTHHFDLSFDNRKKEKFDARIGASASLTNASYSIQSGNESYLRLSYYAEVSVTPTDKWHVAASADINSYKEGSFRSSIVVPLLKAELSRYFLKSNRLALTIEGYDLLNKNKGIERTSEFNYLQEKRSLIIGRYYLLSIKYRINKADTKDGVKIDIK